MLKSNFVDSVQLITLLAVQLVFAQTFAAPLSTKANPPVVVGKLDIVMGEMNYSPATINIAQAGRYEVHVTNTSPIMHDITFSNGVVWRVPAGQKISQSLEIPATGLHFFCSLPGHKDAGMHGMISLNQTPVTESPMPAKKATDSGSSHYLLYDPNVPALKENQLHDIYLTAEEKKINIAEGVSQQLWTYNGQVPGPVIHVRLGDTVRIHLENPATNKLAHSIDFHSSQVAWNDEMASINPGEKKIYEWRADYAGVWMYHCGSNPALHHIASGMYGMVIVEPKEGLEKVDHQFALVQSEFFLSHAGKISNLHKAKMRDPDYVVFNGVANQYKDYPIEVGTGKKVRIFILNAGPNEDSSFHIVGTIFNRVIKEGMELTADNQGHYGAQAVDLSPAQGAIVEFTTAEDGLYPIVTHAFSFVGKGALGLIKAGDGKP